MQWCIPNKSLCMVCTQNYLTCYSYEINKIFFIFNYKILTRTNDTMKMKVYTREITNKILNFVQSVQFQRSKQIRLKDH